MTHKEMTAEDLQNKKKKWRKEQIFACVMASIPLLGFAVFNGFPLIISFIGMFCNVDLYDLTNIQWNNFEGFKSVFIPRHAYELFYFDLAKYFDQICGATMDTSRSSKEAVIEYLLHENGRADNMVMVGDTKFDVIGAKMHGISTIGVSWGYGTISDMKEAGAVKIVNTPQELLDALMTF